ncbi:MAG: helix-turn-helix domain-containing protein [Rhizobiales bacterium]|nr:helix-turn-helix domain-containing protein [Hyphomicrobiales bacterium]
MNDLQTLRTLADIADRWGYRFDVQSVDGRPNATGHDLCLLQGVIMTVESPTGLRVCASDLTSIRDCERAATLSPSLTIIMLLEGDPLSYTLGARNHITLTPGNGVVIAAAEQTSLRQVSSRGSRCRSVVVQACPSDVADVELAGRITAALRTTAAIPLLASCRVQSLANDLFASRDSGAICRLLAESCALELLAIGLGTAERSEAWVTCALRPQDVTKMLRVRDKIISELDRPHRLSDLAQFAGMSVTTLKCKFQAVVGQSVFAFLRDQRLDRGRQGLEREGWTVGQAAYFVGYRHATNFATAFRKRFGVSPTAAPRH